MAQKLLLHRLARHHLAAGGDDAEMHLRQVGAQRLEVIAGCSASRGSSWRARGRLAHPRLSFRHRAHLHRLDNLDGNATKGAPTQTPGPS